MVFDSIEVSKMDAWMTLTIVRCLNLNGNKFFSRLKASIWQVEVALLE
jgi:hypothetical protein